MRRIGLPALALLPLTLVLSMAAACGGDQAPSLEEYLTRMGEIDKDLDTRFETVFGDEDAGAREVATGFKETAVYAGDQYDVVKPAREAKEAHEELVAAIKELVERLDPESFAEDAPVDEFIDNFDSTRVDEAFCDIQKLADDNNIEADVGCEETDESVDPSTLPAQEATEVLIEDFAFDPPHIQISVGDTVTWTQGGDSVSHTATGDDDSFDSDTLSEEGETFEFTFEEAGEFPYACSIHPDMLGLVTVE